MMLITPGYILLQKDLHSRFNYGYGADAAECARIVRGMKDIASILDYGCGRGALGRLLATDFDVREYDPCIKGKDRSPEPADAVVCADVLEHIEPPLLQNVLKHLHDLTEKYLVLVIATGPSAKIMADGRPAHLIVNSASWWIGQLEPFFNIVRSEDRSANGRGLLLICTSKREN